MEIGQKNFKLGPAKRAFEEWCRRNNYTEKTIVLAGLLMLSRIDHTQRVKLFDEVDAWENEGFGVDRLTNGHGPPSGKAQPVNGATSAPRSHEANRQARQSGKDAQRKTG